MNRRTFLKYGSFSFLLSQIGCRSVDHTGTLKNHEKQLIDSNPNIVTVGPENSRGDTSLRRKSHRAAHLTSAELMKIDHVMRARLKKSGGVGLAAPQIGLNRRIFLVMLQNQKKEIITCIDPVIVEKSVEKEDGYEGCLSIPGFGALVPRHSSLKVTFSDRKGTPKTLSVKGFEARIFQHEYDHLEGVLYIDKIKGKLLPWEEVKRLRSQTASVERPDDPHILI
ncbi:peptide deformylase [Myxococcota bacterium]|nr:peptide deformylase [Myxococcota bacterium]MBU1379785.1 peptide deformylase [Myxococcota bacterium]MBU1498503.1 peptide deformylase [Myxococcota bacterium]